MNIKLTQVLPDNTLYWNVAVSDCTVTTLWHSTRSPNLKTHQVTHPSPQKAIADATSLITKKRRAGYVGEKEKPSTKIKPMLAQKFRDQKRLDWPMYLQEKYNGIRAIWDSRTNQLYSRRGKIFPCLPDLEAELAQLPLLYPDMALDGELIVDGLRINEINSIVSRTVELHPMQSSVYYMVYDCIHKAEFQTRMRLLADLNLSKRIHIAPTSLIRSEVDATRILEEHINLGKEGVILRDPYGKYAQGKRAKQLIKYKLEDDEEFECLDVGLDKDGFPILHFKAENGKPFTAVVEGTHHYKASLAERMASLVGCICKVAFAEYTTFGVPFHGRVVLIEE